MSFSPFYLLRNATKQERIRNRPKRGGTSNVKNLNKIQGRKRRLRLFNLCVSSFMCSIIPPFVLSFHLSFHFYYRFFSISPVCKMIKTRFGAIIEIINDSNSIFQEEVRHSIFLGCHPTVLPRAGQSDSRRWTGGANGFVGNRQVLHSK